MLSSRQACGENIWTDNASISVHRIDVSVSGAEKF